MNKKCIGCGSLLQTEDIDKEGYIREENYNNGNLCSRCFKIRNYGEYKIVEKTNHDFIPILENIGKTNDLVVLVVDLFNISNNLEQIKKYIQNDILLVLTKRDVLPLSVYDEKLKQYFNDLDMNIVDTVLISSQKNMNFDELIDKIYKYKKSNNVYVVGYTNAGKSTMINKIIYNYFNNDLEITTSMLPSTTLNSIEIKLSDDLTIIDTPGILNSGDISNFSDIKTLKKINPKKEIKPITYQIKQPQSIFIESLVRIDISDFNSVTLYISNSLSVERNFSPKDKLTNLEKYEFDIKDNQDIVISGLGFFKFVKKGHIIVYSLPNLDIFVRDNLI